MSEQLEAEASIGEVESAPEASAAAMGAAACVSCVGCPFMQRCMLPQAAEARAREPEGQSNESTEPMAEVSVEPDYAAALLDDNGPAVVWAQAAISADPGAVPSEEASSVNERSRRDEAEVAMPASPSWDLSKLWDTSVSESEPLVEPKAALVSELEANPDPISEPEPEERADTALRETYQEVCATADSVETHIAPVVKVRIEPVAEGIDEQIPQVIKPRLAMNETVEQAMIHDDSEASPLEEVDDADATLSPEVAHEDLASPQSKRVDRMELTMGDDAVLTDEAVDCAGEVELPAIQEVVQEMPNAPEIDAERVAATPVHSFYNPPTEIDTPPIVNIIHHENVASEVAVPDTEGMSVSDIAPLVETVSPPDIVASADTASLVVAESNIQPVPALLTDDPVHKACAPRVMDEGGMMNDEKQLDTGGRSLLVADSEEANDNEVLLPSVDMAKEGSDSQASRESRQAVLANVVYNTTQRDDDIVPTEHNSDHVESEAPNAGYGTSWLAAILGVVAVFTVVSRRSSAVY